MLKLRRPERSDLDVVVDWLRDPAFRRFLYGDNEKIKQQMGSHVLALLGGAFGVPIAAAGHFICDAGDHGLVGLASVQDLSWRNRSCTVNIYMANGDEAAKFYGEACFRIVEYCFDELNLHRASARLDSSNEEGQKAFEQIGGARELVLRGHALRDGSPCDVYGYGVLRDDFAVVRRRHEGRDHADVGGSHGA
jgi:RimJ/RimL family protein N-acetyltransferase